MRRRRYSRVVGRGERSRESVDKKIWIVRCRDCGGEIKLPYKKVRKDKGYGFLCNDCSNNRARIKREKNRMLQEDKKERKEARKDRAKRDKLIKEKGLDYVLAKDKKN